MSWYSKDKDLGYTKCIIRHAKPGTMKPLFITNTKVLKSSQNLIAFVYILHVLWSIKVTFHYRSYRLPRDTGDVLVLRMDREKEDNNTKTGNRPITEPAVPIGKHCLIDDTRAMNMDPVEIYTGRDFKLSVWEDMVKTMKVGEIARFSCPHEVCEFYNTHAFTKDSQTALI